MSLNSLIEKRSDIENRIKKLHESQSTIVSQTIETQIKLLQRKIETINHDIEGLCTHRWGDPEWGYTTCTVCGKLRSTRGS